MTIQYTPRGVCSRAFTIQVEDGAIRSVQIVGGCDGNLKGISSLLQGMPVDEASGGWRASAAAGRPPPARTRLPRP